MKIAALFTDGMVLQREKPVHIWGWSVVGQKISIEFQGHLGSAVTGEDGKWLCELPAMLGGSEAFTMTIKGDETIQVKDVLVGEVWVCSGQSNMEWGLEATENSEEEIANSNNSQIRLFTVPRLAMEHPLDDIESSWVCCEPKNVSTFSAVGYYYGKKLHEKLGVPIGLINSSWGGTLAEAWTSRDTLEANVELEKYIKTLREMEEVSSEGKLAKYEKDRIEFLKKLPQDKGDDQIKEKWSSPDFDDSAWQTMKLPNYWQSVGHQTSGVFWFRLTVDVPAEYKGKDLLLNLGAADKSDDTYFNGLRVGGLNWVEDSESYSKNRSYPISSEMVRVGANHIAVRVLSNYTGGGLCGPKVHMALVSAQDENSRIPISGDWKYCIEQDFGPVNGIAEPASPKGHNTPSYLFNGMIAPLLPLSIRGAIWYQGESNADDAERYHFLFKAMIEDWRKHWGQEDFPFYFVQLANFLRGEPAKDYENSAWAKLRDAQSSALTLANTGMAVAIDIGEPDDIHPRNKKDVGLRLAYNALALTYGEDSLVYSGPQLQTFQIESDIINIEFGEELALNKKIAANDVKGFAIAGDDEVFHLAEARIEGTKVIVKNAKVKNPVAVRYAWANSPTNNLANLDGLPAAPFRTDTWPLG